MPAKGTLPQGLLRSFGRRHPFSRRDPFGREKFISENYFLTETINPSADGNYKTITPIYKVRFNY